MKAWTQPDKNSKPPKLAAPTVFFTSQLRQRHESVRLHVPNDRVLRGMNGIRGAEDSGLAQHVESRRAIMASAPESISLRNLSLACCPSSRPRGQTNDDHAVPNTLRSPAKIVAIRERKSLEHSRSSSDLKSVSEHAVGQVEGASEDGSPTKGKSRGFGDKTPQRPSLPRPRRRSTLEWANASPMKRHQRLESVAADRMVNVFFSMHLDDIEEPIYISETAEYTMNPTFRAIDLSSCGPGVTRLQKVRLRFWAQGVKAKQWRRLLDLTLDLSGLQYLGKSLEECPYAFPPNAVVIQFPDGMYAPFDVFAEFVPTSNPALSARSPTQRELNTSSFDALLRLSKLDDSIQDALATRDRLAGDLASLLESNRQFLTERDRVFGAEDRLKTIQFAKSTVEKQVEKMRRQQVEKRQALEKRRAFMIADGEQRAAGRTAMQIARTELPTARREHDAAAKAIQNQRRRICENLQECYTLQPLPKQALAFTIRGLPLPNSEALDTGPVDSTAAAFGYVAHILQLLSFYLDRPLPYPVRPRGSTSTIYDPVSMLKSNASTTQTYRDERKLRTYPLFAQGVPRFRFEYGVFLLNKNIQVLLECAYNVRVLDIRHTLPNLKYLLYIATSGEGELPARKAGGIRGLLRPPGDGTPVLSRAGSDESQSSALGGLLRHTGGDMPNGKPKGAVDSLKKSMGHLGNKSLG